MYPGVFVEALRFTRSFPPEDVKQSLDAGVSLLASLDQAATPRTYGEVGNQAFRKNAEVEAAAKELADALYPVVRGVKAKDIAPLASQTLSAASTGDPKEIIRTLDAGLDAFLSVPPLIRALQVVWLGRSDCCDCIFVL